MEAAAERVAASGHAHVSGCEQRQQWREAVEVLRHLQQAGLHHNPRTQVPAQMMLRRGSRGGIEGV
eukprot:6375517-Pyramimonas_sp.AAC.1